MSKYEPLKHHLEGRSGYEVPVSFAQIEQILGFRLPASARKHQAWWANTGGSHVHAAAWLDAGWRTCGVDLAGERVVFRKAPSETSSETYGVSEASPADGFFVPMAALKPATRRLLEDYCSQAGADPGQAAVAILDAAALERRRALLDRFARESPRTRSDSVELIREDRDDR